MELVPQPLAHLLRRVEREPDQAGTLFDLPLDKTWGGTPDGLDLSRAFHGERSSNVVGPAAGPHTQLAQNIALSYLAGSRICELKTVQILDELKIPRPCIDVENIGFNVEWSQELKIEQSTIEYPKSALLIAALIREGYPAGVEAKDQDYLLDLSLGYDLKGIQDPRVTGFVHAMMDASNVVDRILDELPPDLAKYKDLAVPSRLISCITLSTFHGCPADEIELIARYLLEEIGVHVVVKLNPTLLGLERVQHILHDGLGYTELTLDPENFAHDLKWDQALEMIARLRGVAHRRGLAFGVKLTNTLVVNNHKSFFPAAEKQMYLSGQPLHVLSTTLLAELRRAIPLIGEGGEPPVEYSFSAGIDQHNFPLAAAADLCPVTTCTDLLRPGGYGRLPKYLTNLGKHMTKVGAKDMPTYVLRAFDHAEAAANAVATTLDMPTDHPLRAAAAHLDGGVEGALRTAGVNATEIESLAALWVHEAGTQNAADVAKAALEDPRYAKAKNAKSPKKIGSELELFDCINCDKCVPVCPNNANFAYEVEPVKLDAPTWVFGASGVEARDAIRVDVEKEHQLATFVDFCNGCGNCDIFCPEDGGPYVVKPHWFGSAESCAAEEHLDGFYVDGPNRIAGRLHGRRVALEFDAARTTARYEDEVVSLEVSLASDRVELVRHALRAEADGHEVQSAYIVILRTLLDGVQNTVNPVSAALSS